MRPELPLIGRRAALDPSRAAWSTDPEQEPDPEPPERAPDPPPEEIIPRDSLITVALGLDPHDKTHSALFLGVNTPESLLLDLGQPDPIQGIGRPYRNTGAPSTRFDVHPLLGSPGVGGDLAPIVGWAKVDQLAFDALADDKGARSQRLVVEKPHWTNLKFRRLADASFVWSGSEVSLYMDLQAEPGFDFESVWGVLVGFREIDTPAAVSSATRRASLTSSGWRVGGDSQTPSDLRVRPPTGETFVKALAFGFGIYRDGETRRFAVTAPVWGNFPASNP